MKTFIFANTKGGVSKTHLAYHVAKNLSEKGHSVLCFDLDQQAHLIKLLAATESTTLYDVIYSRGRVHPSECIQKVGDNLYCAYSDTNIRHLDVSLQSIVMGREFILYKLFSFMFDKFDYCIIDMPPSTNITTLNALCFPDAQVIIPVTLNYLSLDGITKLEDYLEEYRTTYSKNISVKNIVVCRDNIEISKHSRACRTFIQETYGEMVCKTSFPHSVHYTNSAMSGLSITKYIQSHNIKKSNQVIEKLNEIIIQILS